MERERARRCLVGAQELAEILGVPVSQLYRQTRLGSIPFIKIGKYLRYDVERVLGALEGSQGPSSEEA